MNWKQKNIIKIPVYIITFVAFIFSLVSSVILIYSIDREIYNSTSFENNSKTITSIKFELRSILNELNSFGYNENDGYLEHIARINSIEQSNLQIKITDTKTNKVILDTFGDGKYGEIITVDSSTSEIIVEGALQLPLSVDDSYMRDFIVYWKFKSLEPIVWGGFVAGIITSIVGLGLIIAMAGHRKGKEGVTCGFLEKVPTDLWLILALIVGIASAFFMVAFAFSGFHNQQDFVYLISMVALSIGCLIIFTDLCIKTIETFATRIKTNTLFKNTLINIIFHTLKQVFFTLPIIWRTLLIGIGLLAINGLLGMLSTVHILTWFVFALYNLFLLVTLCIIAWQFKLLQQGAEKLAKGNLQEKINTTNLYFDCKKHGETLNEISNGIGIAVDEKLKSQKMKTELISNVSHDIKTPLTSIVTCVELLQNEHSDEQHSEYLSLLDRQSMKLKKLVEDLVDASRASTGNITVNLQKTNLVEAINQALGEYSNRFEQQNLQIITNLPEECFVKADGQLLWRTLDNLFSNVYKYALSGTRVYINVINENPIKISIKNISAEPLNITADELLERFIRGESSRTTEGSGLGLNIAQSLIHLQNGKLNLYVDGDFIKVEIYLNKFE